MTEETTRAKDVLKKVFSFRYNDFSDPIEWSDGAGISLIKKYGNGFVSLYKLGIPDLIFENKLQKLIVTVSYGKETEGGVVAITTKNSDPVDLIFRDEFTVDLDKAQLLKDGEEISPRDLLHAVETAHTLPTKPLGGLAIRQRLWFWRTFLPTAIQYFYVGLTYLLFYISGERTKGNIWQKLFAVKATEPIGEKQNDYVDSGTIDFFGYKAKRWSVIFYCILHLILYFIFVNSSIGSVFDSGIFTNAFLVLCYAVASFAFTESLIPAALKWLTNVGVPKLYTYVAFRELDI